MFCSNSKGEIKKGLCFSRKLGRNTASISAGISCPGIAISIQYCPEFWTRFSLKWIVTRICKVAIEQFSVSAEQGTPTVTSIAFDNLFLQQNFLHSQICFITIELVWQINKKPGILTERFPGEAITPRKRTGGTAMGAALPDIRDRFGPDISSSGQSRRCSSCRQHPGRHSCRP